MANENAVALKLPPFWISQPRVWFQEAEAQFALRNITADDTKYFYVVAALDQETASCLIDFLENRSKQDNMAVLRNGLLQHSIFKKYITIYNNKQTRIKFHIFFGKNTG